LTYLPKDKVKVNRWAEFENALLNYSDVDNNRDYYIIVVDKSTKKVYLNSLKSLAKITANGNNLPFQIKWVDNLNPVVRTHRQAYDFIVECYKKSVIAKINAHPFYEKL
jgi:cellulose synthase/poly-beta-1,6-N-acetylglucosamine synthase-like glycosyltransferase